MKNKLIAFVLCTLFFVSCDDEEQMQYANIYFPLSTWASKSDFFVADFSYEKDTTFVVGAYCGGSIAVPQDVRVVIGLATDSLQRLQLRDPSFGSYELLPEDSYEITPSDRVAIIEKGTHRGDLAVLFRTTRLDPSKQYVLPLRIESTSHYEIASRHSYLFFGIKNK